MAGSAEHCAVCCMVEVLMKVMWFLDWKCGFVSIGVDVRG